MTIVRVGVQAVSTSAGQAVDFDFSSVALASVVNRSNVVVQYSTNSGAAWTNIAANATASIGLTLAATAFRLRLVAAGAYPAPVDVEFEGVQAAGGGVSIISAVATGADDFKLSKLRGMSADNITDGAPRSFEYVEIYSRFRANVSRRFVIPLSSGLGTPYALTAGTYTTLEADLASFAAIGCRTIICASPTRPGEANERRDPTWFASEAAKAEFARWWGEFALRWAGDKRIAAFDIINEPYNSAIGPGLAGTEQILELQEACIAAIRAADPTRVCIVTCGEDGAPSGFTTMRPVPFDNVVYTFHFYQPYVITHANVAGQPAFAGVYPSADVVAGEFGSGVSLFAPTQADKNRMYRDMQAPIAFAKRYGVPIFVGEFGCSRMVAGGVAPNWIEDAISVFNEVGFSWAYFGFWFPPSQWSCFVLDSSAALIDFNDGTEFGQRALNLFTGGSTTARTPIVPVSAAMADNALFIGADRASTAGVYVEETFEGTYGRLGGAGSSGAQDPGMTLTIGSTAAPKRGTKHLRCTHTSTVGGSSQRAGLYLQDVGSGKTFTDYYFSADVALRSAITAGNVLTLLDVGPFGAGSGEFIRLRNNSGTNTWLLDLWRGTGDFGARPTFQVTGLTLPVGSYTRLKMAWTSSESNGRIRLWQDGRLLVDINGFPTTANSTNRLWSVFYGLLFSTQVGQTVDFDDVRYSAGADLT